MALTFGFYDSVNGDRTYSAKEFSRFFDGILNDGVFGDIGDAFKVTPGSGLNVNVGTGRAWFNRTWTYNSGDMSLALSTAEPTLNRIDTIAIIIDEPTRTNSISVIKGTPASNPVAPTLTKTAEHLEYRLSDVYVAANTTSISANNITNFVGTEQTPYVNIAGSMLFFANDILPVMDGTASIGVEKSYSRADHKHPTDTSRAPIQSPEFTGTPKAPTAADGTSTTQLATTAFVQNRISALLSSNSTFSGDLNFSGNATAKTQASSDNSTKIATTAFVKSVINDFSARVYDATVSRTKNTVLAAPNGSNGAASFRALVAADIPTLTKSKISDFPTSMTPTAHNHAAGDINSGTLGVARGGTGAASFTANSVVMSGSTTTAALTTRAVTNNTSSTAIAASTNIPTMNTIYYGLNNRLNRTTAVSAADTAYTTPMARGIALYASTATPSLSADGTIAFTYE